MIEEESGIATLNLSKKQLKKVPKQEEAQNVRTLILDENELQKIDNIDSYLKLEKLSLSKNQLLRMYGICRLHNLRELNLSFNGILSIEGLKDCIHLRHLNLEGNNVKTIEHLNNNILLEYLNLAENTISSIADISFLTSLKELYLHGNRISHLRQCDKHLPTSLEVLTLAKNGINDLNEICTLSHLINLHSITISENPCVMMTNGPTGPEGFDHRPFVLNWCLSLKVIDGFLVDPIESLKAEWLYSQGRGRQFRLGEQASLTKYLSSVCPLIGKALENENERKLRLILSKAQHHQRQLQEEISENSNTPVNSSPSTGRKKSVSRIHSPRFSRLSGRQGSPESMISSYHGNTSHEQISNTNLAIHMTTSLIENIKNDPLMLQSLENSSVSSIGLSGCNYYKSSNSHDSSPRTLTPNPSEQLITNTTIESPLVTASKMVPVPETLMSPDVCPSSVAQRVAVSALSSHMSKSINKKKLDNKIGSSCSPLLKRFSDQSSPIMSPKKVNSNHIHQKNSRSQTPNKSKSSVQSKSELSNNLINAIAQEEIFSSDDESDDINLEKLTTIRNRAAQRCQEVKDCLNITPDKQMDISAVIIQKIWRGYRTRQKTKYVAEKLLKKRTFEYIEKLTKDVETTKYQLENEHKIQQLQMQAINALWKKVSAMQVSSATEETGTESMSYSDNGKTLTLDSSSTVVVQDLAKTCTMLTNQVQKLQSSMKDILNCLTLFCNLSQEDVKRMLITGINDISNPNEYDSAATQTEIIAVHTPQVENISNFPFAKLRPSSLSIDPTKTENVNLETEKIISLNITNSTIKESQNEINNENDQEKNKSTSIIQTDE